MPDSAAGGQSPQTLKSSRRRANGCCLEQCGRHRARHPCGTWRRIPRACSRRRAAAGRPCRARRAVLLDREQRHAPRRASGRRTCPSCRAASPRPAGSAAAHRACRCARCTGPGLRRRREAQRFVEGAMPLLRLLGRHPLAEDRGVAARLQQVAVGVAHLVAVEARTGRRRRRAPDRPARAGARVAAGRPRRSRCPCRRCGRSRAGRWRVRCRRPRGRGSRPAGPRAGTGMRITCADFLRALAAGAGRSVRGVSDGRRAALCGAHARAATGGFFFWPSSRDSARCSRSWMPTSTWRSCVMNSCATRESARLRV